MKNLFNILSQIPDPEIPVINIVELGIVRDAKWLSENEIEVVITPTYSACPAMFNIEEDIIKLFQEKEISAKSSGNNTAPENIQSSFKYRFSI